MKGTNHCLCQDLYSKRFCNKSCPISNGSRCQRFAAYFCSFDFSLLFFHSRPYRSMTVRILLYKADFGLECKLMVCIGGRDISQLLRLGTGWDIGYMFTIRLAQNISNE